MSADRMALPVDVFMKYTDKNGSTSVFAHRVISDMTTDFVRSRQEQAIKDGGNADQITEAEYQRRKS